MCRLLKDGAVFFQKDFLMIVFVCLEVKISGFFDVLLRLQAP